MVATTRTARLTLTPIHAILLAFPIALFSGAVVSDIAYLNTAEMQWTNFAAWMITGGLVFGGLVLIWAIVEAILARRAGLVRAFVYPAVLAVMWIVALVNIFQHSRDAWSSVGALGLSLSLISALLALAAGWMLHSRTVVEEVAR